MSAHSVIEENTKWCAAASKRCCLAEHVWGEGQAAGRSIRQIVWRIESIRRHNWEGSWKKLPWRRDVP